MAAETVESMACLLVAPTAENMVDHLVASLDVMWESIQADPMADQWADQPAARTVVLWERTMVAAKAVSMAAHSVEN